MFLDQEDNVIAWILDGEGRTFVVADSDPFDMGRVVDITLTEGTLDISFDKLIDEFWERFGRSELKEVSQSALQYASLN
jgi:hypothetical protein